MELFPKISLAALNVSNLISDVDKDDPETSIT